MIAEKQKCNYPKKTEHNEIDKFSLDETASLCPVRRVKWYSRRLVLQCIMVLQCPEQMC
jgi:hypothetical protein